jgi:pyruvate dehydrogenase (quinone)
MIRQADLDRFTEMIEDAKSVAIPGGNGCRDAHDEVVALATSLKAPVGSSFRGKQWLEGVEVFRWLCRRFRADDRLFGSYLFSN